MPRSTSFRLRVILPALAFGGAAVAGPPFVTDDPGPTDPDHFEIFLFSEGTRTHDGFESTLPGLEINYGAASDLQLAATFEQAYDAPRGASSDWHYGQVEVGVKYRFLHEDEAGWKPQVAFYPSAELPEGQHRPSTFLPLWAQKSLGAWDVFGGGGPRLNPGKDARDTWFVGAGVLRHVTDALELGGEVFRETSETRGEKAASGFDLAALYDLSDRWHVVGSAGRGLTAVSRTNEFSYYVGLELLAP